jgi:hypothetical protein
MVGRSVLSIGEYEADEDIEGAMNAGIRWFSKPGGKLCMKAPNGQSECNGTYRFSSGYLFIRHESK